VSREEIVLWLLDDWSDEVEAVGDPPRLGDLLRGPLGGPPVEGPSLVDDPVHGAHGLLHGRGGVGAVAVDDVDVVGFEALERGLEPLDDVLAREALVVGALAAPEELGGEDDVGAAPAEVADGLAHDLLGAAVGVDLGVVEEVDAGVAARLQQRLGVLDVELVAEGDPGAVGELAHAEARAAQVPVLHLASSSSPRRRRRGALRGVRIWGSKTRRKERRGGERATGATAVWAPHAPESYFSNWRHT
jgi:hypothetical protein